MGDTIRNPKLRTKDDALCHFDVVVANPPFSPDKWGVEASEVGANGGGAGAEGIELSHNPPLLREWDFSLKNLDFRQLVT